MAVHRRALLGVGLAVVAWAGAGHAAETLTVNPITDVNFGGIILSSASTTTITQNANGTFTVSSPAIKTAGNTQTVTIPVTVSCTDGGGNGCKGNTHHVTISGVRVQGRQLAVTSFNVTTPTVTSGNNTSVGLPSGTNPLTFDVISASNGSQSWTVTFSVGMVVSVTPASSSSVPTKWSINVKLT